MMIAFIRRWASEITEEKIGRPATLNKIKAKNSAVPYLSL
jgi:hypothetical protein